MRLYTMMPLMSDRIDELCEDIADQYERKIANEALFIMNLQPEGDPVSDKAANFCETYDIYAEWPLKKEAFDAEVSRVRALYENSAEKYDIVQRGNYTCFFAYDGDAPFEEATDNYTYYIFAFDEQNLIVRYILCISLENGVDQPYYLSLDW